MERYLEMLFYDALTGETMKRNLLFSIPALSLFLSCSVADQRNAPISRTFRAYPQGTSPNITFESISAARVPFVENRGQLPDAVKYYARTFAGTLFVTDQEFVYKLPFYKNKRDRLSTFSQDERTESLTLRESFVSSKGNVPKAIGEEEAKTRIHSFLGSDSRKWVSGAKTFEAVQIEEVWDGISVTLRAHGNNVEKIFTVLPGSDSKAISLRLTGMNSLSIDSKTGELVVETIAGEVRFTKPIAFQELNGARAPVEVSYLKTEEGYGFSVGDYDSSRPLIIDPLLATAYLGSSLIDSGYSIAIGASGSVYVVGEVEDTDFPTAGSPYDSSQNGGRDAFVAKISADLATLEAATFLGGAGTDRAYGVALDSSENVYVTGEASTGFPTAGSPYDATNAGGKDFFVAKLTSDLSTLTASTFLGGSFAETATSIAIGASGNIYVTGYSLSNDFPTTGSAYDSSHNASDDIVVSKLNSNLSALLASTYIGTVTDDIPFAIAVDSSENVYITGSVVDGYPATGTPYDATWNGDSDVFVSKFNSSLSTLVASTYIGGPGTDMGFGITLDSSANVYVTGRAASGYPTAGTPYDSGHNGGDDIFVSILPSSLQTLTASTFIGGSGNDWGQGIALAPSGDVYVAGKGGSGFPKTANAYGGTISSTDVVIVRLDSAISQLKGSTNLTGLGNEVAYGVAISSDGGSLYITGETDDGSLQGASGTFQTSPGGGSLDGFVSRIGASLTNESTAPTVSYVDSPHVPITYKKEGDEVTVSVHFTEDVIVTGTPQLTLETGSSDAVANYVSGTGTSTVNFSFTVVPGHAAFDMDYASTSALSLNGGIIRDLANNNATLTLPTLGGPNSLSGREGIIVDTSAPTIVGVSSLYTNQAYGAGSVLSIQVIFSEDIVFLTTGGTPSITLETGTIDRVVSITGGNQSDRPNFNYTVQAGDNSTDLDYVSTGALVLNGGTIRDAAGHDAILTLPTPGAAGSLASNKNLVIDTTAPIAPVITSPTSGTTISDTTPSISGTGESGATIQVYRAGNVSLGTTTATSGTWSLVAPQLAETTHSLTARATDSVGNIGTTSSAVSVAIDTTNTDGDDLADAEDPDDDNDGVSDSQEQLDGTDSRDEGSSLPTLANSFCYEWNGFLGMLNIAEFVNLASSSRNIVSTLYDISGNPQGAAGSSVLAAAQTDLLVHDISGFTRDSYGKVCSVVSDGSAGDIDGRMVHYRSSTNGIEYAFAMALTNGSTGSVFSPFNTFTPSLDSADTDDFVANFITVSNLDNDNSQGGTLYYYAQDGTVLGSEAATLLAGGRRDFSGHQFGRNLVGMVEWRPSSTTASFQVRNVRYLYNAPLASATGFDGAFQLEGIKGSGRTLYAPIDTRSGSSIVELGNTTSGDITYTLTLYDNEGNQVTAITQSLPAHGSVHVIMDSLLPSALGSVSVEAAGEGRMIATVMQYGRTTTAGINYLYGIYAKEALGSIVKGSYNNFINQGCRLILVNSTASSETVTISMTRYDGTNVLSGSTIAVPAHGTAESNVCANDSANTLGVITVQPSTNNSIIAQVIRYGDRDTYRFPTPVR